MGFIFLIIFIILVHAFIRYGLLLYFLKCPKCNARGKFRRKWDFSSEAPKNQDDSDILDAELAYDSEKILECQSCKHKLYI